MTKLTDTQLMVLSNAVAREDGVGVVPPRMNKAASAKVGSSLVARKLMREIRAKPGMPIWREGEEGGASASSSRGRVAMRSASWTRVSRRPPSRSPIRNLKIVERPPVSGLPRAGSKQALIVGMLSKDEGATLDALIAATGWLPHTTRAALTGLRKRGYLVERMPRRDQRIALPHRARQGFGRA